jgi:hypothetical protein
MIRADYWGPGADTGHVLAQEPQSVHLLASMAYLSLPSVMASAGHSLAHAPHAMHSSLMT